MVGKDLIMATLFGSGGGSSGSGWGGDWPEAPDDGKTRLYIHLSEGRTSPMIGMKVNGLVTIDWGDRTEPYELSGTSTNAIVWTTNHEYTSPGFYVITITVEGAAKFAGVNSVNQYSAILRASDETDGRNNVYQNAVRRVEIGSGFANIDAYSFQDCRALQSVKLPEGITNIYTYAFQYCDSLSIVKIPGSVALIAQNAFYGCYSVAYYDFTSHTAVPTLASSNVFAGIPADCEIRVPAALYDEWIAATNWATCADYIKAY